MAVVHECDVWVDVGSAASAARNNLVLNNRDIVFVVVERAVGLDNEGERKLRLLQQRVGRGNSIESRTDIFGRAVGRLGASDAGLEWALLLAFHTKAETGHGLRWEAG